MLDQVSKMESEQEIGEIVVLLKALLALLARISPEP